MKVNGIDIPLVTQRMLQEDGTAEGDRERLALFYVLGSVSDLAIRHAQLYDTERHVIRPEGLDGLSSGVYKMAQLAFNLYNERMECPAPAELFGGLDVNNGQIALNALRLRFDF